MAFSLDSKVKDILKNPEASAVLDKYSPDASKNPQMKQKVIFLKARFLTNFKEILKRNEQQKETSKLSVKR